MTTKSNLVQPGRLVAGVRLLQSKVLLKSLLAFSLLSPALASAQSANGQSALDSFLAQRGGAQAAAAADTAGPLDRVVSFANQTVQSAPSGVRSWVQPTPTASIRKEVEMLDRQDKLDGDSAIVSPKITAVLQRATSMLGTPYRWGGTTPSGFDCSGLVGWVFRNALGVELPRVSRDMARQGLAISDRSKMVPGDLVFFGDGGRVNHVGIYVGNGRFLHAPSTGKNVMISAMDSGYWGRKFLAARRVEGL